LRIIFMGLGIAKVHEESIPKELGNVTVIASHHLCTGGLIGTDHLPVLFGVELAGESCRVHQITKHHGQLATFGVGSGRANW
jgi:hypothetical protein